MLKYELLQRAFGGSERGEAQGYVEKCQGRSLVLLGTFLRGCDIAEPVQEFVAAFRYKYPRNHIVFVARDRREKEILSENFPEDRIINEPNSEGYSFGRVLHRLKAQLLLFIDIPDDNLARWLDQATKTGATIAMIETGAGARWRYALTRDLDRSLLRGVRLFATNNRRSYQDLKAAGISESKLRSTETRSGLSDRQVQKIIDWMGPILSTKELPRKYWARRKLSKKNIKRWGSSGALGQWLIGRNHRLVHNLPDLLAELGSFQSILCLGNGPSSEDPRLRSVGYDCLFRVNHRWMKRGLLAEPDMIFTGNKSSIRALGPDKLFGLPTIEAECRLAFDLFPTLSRYAFVSAERIGLYDFEAFATYRPTNGAVMVATAVALAPEKLIIAGIDMFEHPSGSYPGDKKTPNAYTLNHDRNTELQYLLKTLASYDGELVILSPVLNDYWQAYRRSRDAYAVAQSA